MHCLFNQLECMTASSFVNVILSNIKKLKGIGTVLRTLVCPAKNILWLYKRNLSCRLSVSIDGLLDYPIEEKTNLNMWKTPSKVVGGVIRRVLVLFHQVRDLNFTWKVFPFFFWFYDTRHGLIVSSKSLALGIKSKLDVIRCWTGPKNGKFNLTWREG